MQTQETLNLNLQKINQLEKELLSLYNAVGVNYSKSKNYEISTAYYQKGIALNPNGVGLKNNLALDYINIGNSYFDSSKYLEASELYIKALNVKPGHSTAVHKLTASYVNQAIEYKKSSNFELANNLLMKAADLSPDMHQIYLHLGLLYVDWQQLDRAIAYFNKAIALKPDYVDAYCNLGNAYYTDFDYFKALACYQKTLELNPNHPQANCNIGTTYFKVREYDKAIQHCEKSLTLNSNIVEAKYNLATSYLITGQMQKGWEHYEYRLLRDNNSLKIPTFDTPIWDGKDIRGKTLYVYSEQGFGDTIMFCRYLHLLEDRGAKVLFKPQPPLKQIIKESNFNVELLDYNIDDHSVEFDEHIPLLSLPNVLKSYSLDVPYPNGYLKTNAEKVQTYKEKYFNNDNFKVGIFWQGNIAHSNDKNRSIPLKFFKPLLNLPNVEYYSFQRDYGLEQLKSPEYQYNFVDIGSTIRDFTDTAATIENLDLIITVDSAIAHIAGAINKPAWVIMPLTLEWRWLYARDDSPWYNSLKLFTPDKSFKWDGVMDDVCKAFVTKVEEHNKTYLSANLQ